MNVTLVKRYRFEAAHRTPRGRGPNGLHGHSYEVDVAVEGPVDARLGWLIDYGEISRLFDPVYKALDHRLLDDVAGLDDVTLTGLETWIGEQLRNKLPYFHAVRVRITGDGEFAPAPTRSPGGETGLRFTFEAAHALPELPPEHKCFRMHGHSFAINVATKGDNPAILSESVRTVYDALDHRCLNDIPGLANPTSEYVSRWVWERLAANHPKLITVSVAETCTAECHYHGQ